jgi:asparaginyl-tRNA synthetase
MVEPEMAYATLDDVMDAGRGLVVYVVGGCSNGASASCRTLERDTSRLEGRAGAVPAHLYDEAAESAPAEGAALRVGRRLRRAGRDGAVGGVRPAGLRPPLPGGGEGVLHEARSGSPELALGVDVLAPEGYGEIIGGGERLDDLDLLLQRIKEHDLPQEAFEWYLDLRRYGSVPHGGFGMGIERVVAWICGLEHLREPSPTRACSIGSYPNGGG